MGDRTVKQKVDNESKRDRFKRLAASRTNKVIESLRVLGHCSNSRLYEYDERDVKKIFSALEKEVKRLRIQFEKPQKVELSL